MADYEIRYHREDGSLSLIYKPNCGSDGDARKMLDAQAPKDKPFSAEIWKDDDRIQTVTSQHIPYCDV